MDGGSSHAAWVGSLFWLIHFEDGCEVSMDIVKASFSLELIRKVPPIIVHLHDRTRSGSNKRRRVGMVLNQFSRCMQEGASAGSSASHFGVVLVDEAVPTSSASSSSDSLPLSPPDWLIGGSEILFRSIHPVQPGLSSPSIRHSDALRIVSIQLRNKVWEETQWAFGAKLRVGNSKPRQSGDVVSKIFIPREYCAFTKSSAKHRLVWISGLRRLRRRLQKVRRRSLSSISLEECCRWRGERNVYWL